MKLVSLKRAYLEIVRIGGMVLGRASYEPGWKWSKYVSPIAGTPLLRQRRLADISPRYVLIPLSEPARWRCSSASCRRRCRPTGQRLLVHRRQLLYLSARPLPRRSLGSVLFPLERLMCSPRHSRQALVAGVDGCNSPSRIPQLVGQYRLT